MILISIALLSCSNGNRVSNNGTFMTLHIDTTQCHDVCWSDIVKEYDWIVLENNNNCFVDDPCKTLFFDDNLYVVDGTRNNAILVFDGSGKYINRIGRKGNGHGEYVNIVDATINEDDKQIAILSFPNTVYIYELDGTFVSKHIFPEDVYYSIAYYCKGYILSNSNATYIEVQVSPFISCSSHQTLEKMSVLQVGYIG